MFYSSIAENYNYIFPQNRDQLSLISLIIDNNFKGKILDIGCATGNLTQLLLELSNDVYGVDIDKELLSIAEREIEAKFKCLNMLDLEICFDSTSLSLVVSFGNTLVHLSSLDQVEKYFNSVFNILEVGGSFITQIINYDRVEKDKISSLATINNQNIEFVRDYTLVENGRFINFDTKLTIKESGEVITNSVKLLTLKKTEIESLLGKIGFKDIYFYGNLKGAQLNENSTPLIFSCKK